MKSFGSRAPRRFVGSLALIVVPGLNATSGSPAAPGLELFPRHFRLKPGERIHYQVMERSEGTELRFVDASFSVEDPTIVRLSEPATGVLEALRPGRSQLIVHTATSERRVSLEVAGRREPPIVAVPHATVREIATPELLFVGHANLDGGDHTAVAKLGGRPLGAGREAALSRIDDSAGDVVRAPRRRRACVSGGRRPIPRARDQGISGWRLSCGRTGAAAEHAARRMDPSSFASTIGSSGSTAGPLRTRPC